jgi:hypothetical protein
LEIDHRVMWQLSWTFGLSWGSINRLFIVQEFSVVLSSDLCLIIHSWIVASTEYDQLQLGKGQFNWFSAEFLWGQ